MKRSVLVFGLISGVIITAMMSYAAGKYCETGNFKDGMIYGYTAMLLSFSMIFVGIKSFRDRYNNGVVSFGKAFKLGFFIVLISSTFYVLTWMVEYTFFFPDFAEKYAAGMIKAAERSGETAQEIAKKTAEMEKFKQSYKNPLFVIVMTYLEILPVGVVVALISALILKRKTRKAGGGE